MKEGFEAVCATVPPGRKCEPFSVVPLRTGVQTLSALETPISLGPIPILSKLLPILLIQFK